MNVGESKDVRFVSVSGADSVRQVSVWRPISVLELDRRTKKWRKKPSSLIYDPSGAKGGSLFWCERGRREQTLERCIDIDSITSISFGRDAARHVTGTINGVTEKTAFAVATKSQQHCFEEESEEMRGVWLEALRHVLANTAAGIAGGVSIKLEGYDEKARSGSFAVTRKKTPKEMVLGLTNGRYITEHHGGHGFSVYLFYKGLGLGKLGTFYWCEPGEEKEIPTQSMPLSEVTEILVGRQSAEFADYASPEACISVIGKSRSVHIEELSGDDAKEWLAAVQALYSAAGALVLCDVDNANRMTVTQPPKSASSVSASAATASSSSRKKTPKATNSSSSMTSSGGSLSPGQSGGASTTGFSGVASGGSVKRHPSPGSSTHHSSVRRASPAPIIPITVTAAAAARGTSPPRYSSTKRAQSPPRRTGGLRKSSSNTHSTTMMTSTGLSTVASSANVAASFAATAPTVSAGGSMRKVAFNSAVTVKKMPSHSSRGLNSGSGKKESTDRNNNSSATNSGSGHDEDDSDNDNDDDDELRATPRDDPTLSPPSSSSGHRGGSRRSTNNGNDTSIAPLADGPARAPLQSFHDDGPPPANRRVPGSAAIVIRVLEDDDDKEQTLTTEQAVKMLRTGREVNMYDGMTGQKRVMNAWYEPPVIGQDGLGSFYCTLAGNGRAREEWPDQSLPLATLTDLTLGKDHIEFRRMASAIHAPDTCCFSLVSPTLSWHIQEKAAWRADAWVEAIQYLLRSAGSLVITEAEAMEERSRGQHGPHARKYSFAARRVSSVPPGLAAVRSMCMGREATWWQLSGPRRVFIFYQPRTGELGTLFWCLPGQRQQVTGQQLALHTLLDIYHGRKTPVMQSPMAQSASIEYRCFSLVTSDGILDLEEDSEDGAWLWMQGLQHILEKAGTDVQLYDPNYKSPTSGGASATSPSSLPSIDQSPPPKPRPSTSDPSTPRALQKAAQQAEMLKSISKGRVVSLWEESGASEVYLCYRSDGHPGSLYWLPIGSVDQATDGKRLMLAELTAVTVGKTSGHLKAAPSTIRDDCCFSLIARSRTLDIQDKTPALAAEWVRSLHHLLLQAGAAVTPARGTGSGSTPRPSMSSAQVSSARRSIRSSTMLSSIDSLTPPASAALPMTSLTAEEAINRMVTGRRVTRFDRNGDHADIFLFYKPAANKDTLGCLYWVEPDHVREASLTRSFPLATVTDLYIGLHTPTLKAAAMAAGGQSERCLSLVGRDGVTLDIMESTSEQALMWFDAIRTVLSGVGADLTSESQGINRRISLARPSIAKDTAVAPWVKTPAEAMKLLQAGRNVILYEAGVIAGQEAFVFLTTVADSTNPGTLYWCPRGLPEEKQERSFNLADLTEIYTGRQTAVLKSPAATDAQPQACFSLLFNGLRALHIEEESRDRLPLWLDSIHQLLSLLNRRVVVDEAWPTAEDRGRHFLIETMAPRLSVSNSANFKLMREGRDWLLYESESKPPTPVFLFYHRDSTRHGSLYWCNQGTREVDVSRSLPLHSVTDIYVGKNTPLLMGDAAKDAREERCVTIVASSVSLALEAQSAAYLAAWLPALDQLLQTFGQMKPTPNDDSILHESSGSSSPTLSTPAIGGGFAAALGIASMTQAVKGDVRRYSIAQYQLPGELPVSPGELLKQASEGQASFLAVNPRATLAMMERGQEFGHYTSFKSERVLVYYKQGEVGEQTAGFLYWSDNLKRDDRPQNRLAIAEVTEVRLGKDTAAFNSPWAHYADKSTCFSLCLSTGHTLDLEAKSMPVLASWLFGISTLLTQAGFGVRLVTSQRAPDAFDGEKKSSDEERRFVVERRSDEEKLLRDADSEVARDSDTLHPALRQPPKTLLRQLSRRRKTLESLSPDNVLSIMEKGRVFTGYALNRRGEFSQRRILVFYSPGLSKAQQSQVAAATASGGMNGTSISSTASGVSNHGQGYGHGITSGSTNGQPGDDDLPRGCLHWCAVGQRLESHHFSLPLAKVRELQLGKQSPVFQHAGAAHAVEDRCVTIVGVGINLDLEARSSDQLSAWLFGINTLLAHAGREAFSREDDTAEVEGRMLAAGLGIEFVAGERTVAPGDSNTDDFRRRFSVRPSSPLPLGQLYALPSLILEPTAPALMKQVWARRKTFVALSPAEAVRMMVTGCNFNLYTDTGVVPIFLFYSPSVDGGALYWRDQPTLPSTPVTRVESPDRRLFLRDIAEIAVGKRGPLKQAAGNAARVNRCFVLIGTPQSLYLEAETAAHVNAWLFGVNRVLAALPGRRAAVDTHKEESKAPVNAR